MTATVRLREIDPDLITGPGPGGFLPPGLAVSFFFLWTIGAMGQPVGMVRLMACRDTPTLRTSLFMIGLYYSLIYLPLVVTFVCAGPLSDRVSSRTGQHHAGDGVGGDRATGRSWAG